MTQRTLEDAARTSEYWKAELLAANVVIERQRRTIAFVRKQLDSVTPDWVAVHRWLSDSLDLDKPTKCPKCGSTTGNHWMGCTDCGYEWDSATVEVRA